MDAQKLKAETVEFSSGEAYDLFKRIGEVIEGANLDATKDALLNHLANSCKVAFWPDLQTAQDFTQTIAADLCTAMQVNWGDPPARAVRAGKGRQDGHEK
jgi:hypothetical protein